MRIKKHESGNEYILSGGVWIRNFLNDPVVPLQLSSLFQEQEYNLVLKNDSLNKNYPKISNEKIQFKQAVIVSDGYQFESRHKFLKQLSRDTAILAVNKALVKWSLMSGPVAERRSINAYIVNNPFSEAMYFLPPKSCPYYPTCIASSRTNHEFLKKYLGDVYTYMPTSEVGFGMNNTESYCIDDYRNAICAAIQLACRFKVQKILLLCCDDSFEEKRDYAVKLKNGLFTYPQHLISHDIIEGNLHWIANQEDVKVQVGNYSSGPEYKNAEYINDEDSALNFLRGQMEYSTNVK